MPTTIKMLRQKSVSQSLYRLAKAEKAGSRLFSVSSISQNAKQSEFLKIKNPRMREAIVEGYANRSGPPSLKSRSNRIRYSTPNGLDNVFPLAYKIIQEESQKFYSKAEELQKQLSSTPASETEQVEFLQNEIEKALIQAEVDNPEVQYNFKIGQYDLDIPVYRHLLKKKWEDYDLLILMQRLETLSVIPDTEPTLDPKVDVKLQFPGSESQWVEPGTVLPCSVCTYYPHLVVQEFEKVPENTMYTVLIVDPDTPNLEKDSYQTTLHWALANVPLSLSNPVVDPEASTELMSYLPPVPEKNTGKHRYAVWVYRQDEKIDPSTLEKDLITRDKFDIRRASKQLGLTAVGAHLWRSHFDITTESLREKYGLPAGRVFSRTRE